MQSTITPREGTDILGEHVTREWTRVLDDGRTVTSSVRLIPHTNPAHVPLSPSDRYTVYTDTPATFNHVTFSKHDRAMDLVEIFTERMNARTGWTRTR